MYCEHNWSDIMPLKFYTILYTSFSRYNCSFPNFSSGLSKLRHCVMVQSCQCYPGYFREPHWNSIGQHPWLPWQVWWCVDKTEWKYTIHPMRSGVLCPKKVSRARTSNYIPQILWDVITCPCPWYMLLAQHSIFHGVYCRYWWFCGSYCLRPNDETQRTIEE